MWPSERWTRSTVLISSPQKLLAPRVVKRSSDESRTSKIRTRDPEGWDRVDASVSFIALPSKAHDTFTALPQRSLMAAYGSA